MTLLSRGQDSNLIYANLDKLRNGGLVFQGHPAKCPAFKSEKALEGHLPGDPVACTGLHSRYQPYYY
jgi:hypothetical protein